ncbi:MAG TPA: ABC transporter permease [Chloroflexota bacterium]|nr:ABC transporter permease [Chloroflexota bacterium]
MADTVQAAQPDAAKGRADPDVVERGAGRSGGVTWGDLLRALVDDKVVLIAVCFILLVIGSATFAAFVSPHDPYAQSIRTRMKPPMTPAAQEGAIPHLLGTDQLGRDVLARLIYGARISLTVGVATALFSGTVGVTLGLIAGFYRGRLDDLIMRLVDLQMSLPGLLLALFVLYALGPSFVNLILVAVVTRWMVYCRITRGMMLSLRERPFVEAARALGCSDRRLILLHMLPNLFSPIIVLATLEIATMMLALAALDFLGMGIQPPESSWGLMLAQGRESITTAWWLVTFPGLAIMLTALSFNVLATWVRVVTDPVSSWRWVRRGAARAAA